MSDWLKIQAGLAELIASRLSGEEIAEIRAALDEADADFKRGDVLSSEEMRRHFGLQ